MNVTVTPIRTVEDFDSVVARFEAIFMAETGTPEADERDVLAALIEAYERIHYPFGNEANALDLKGYLKEHGIKSRDLTQAIGPAAQVTTVLNGRRDLTIGMIKRLHTIFGIPYEVLMNSVPSSSDHEMRKGTARIATG